MYGHLLATEAAMVPFAHVRTDLPVIMHDQAPTYEAVDLLAHAPLMAQDPTAMSEAVVVPDLPATDPLEPVVVAIREVAIHVALSQEADLHAARLQGAGYREVVRVVLRQEVDFQEVLLHVVLLRGAEYQEVVHVALLPEVEFREAALHVVLPHEAAYQEVVRAVRLHEVESPEARLQEVPPQEVAFREAVLLAVALPAAVPEDAVTNQINKQKLNVS